MRTTRMRAALAGVLGMTLIGIASPAWADPIDTNDEPTPTAEATATASTEPTQSALLEATGSPSADPSATPTPEGLAQVAPDPSSTSAAVVAEPTGSPTATPVSVRTTTGDPVIDSFLPVLPFKINFDKVIDDPTDLDLNPLLLSYTCTGNGPDWKIQNLADKPYGFGWFDTNLGGGIAEIGPKQTLDIDSNALAVIASPWDGETKLILVTVPSVGVSDCPGTPPAAVPPAGVTTVGLPAAPAATPVSGEPHYTR